MHNQESVAQKNGWVIAFKGGSNETLDKVRRGIAKCVNFFIRPPLPLVKKVFAPLTDVEKKVDPPVGQLPNNNFAKQVIWKIYFLKSVDPASWNQILIGQIYVCSTSAMIKKCIAPLQSSEKSVSARGYLKFQCYLPK